MAQLVAHVTSSHLSTEKGQRCSHCVLTGNHCSSMALLALLFLYPVLHHALRAPCSYSARSCFTDAVSVMPLSALLPSVVHHRVPGLCSAIFDVSYTIFGTSYHVKPSPKMVEHYLTITRILNSFLSVEDTVGSPKAVPTCLIAKW